MYYPPVCFCLTTICLIQSYLIFIPKLPVTGSMLKLYILRTHVVLVLSTHNQQSRVREDVNKNLVNTKFI